MDAGRASLRRHYRKMRLFSYKMTSDSGFAPNPFGRTLTLAACKPMIRQSKHEGDWVAGFTSKTRNGDGVGSERLIYLMHVAEKLLLRDYFSDARFQNKIPDMSARGPAIKAGDNIYRPLRPGAVDPLDFEQLPNANHKDRNQQRDVSGRFVLIADEFYYCDRGALNVPPRLRPELPHGQSGQGKQTPPEQARRFIKYIRRRFQPGRHGHPHRWPQGPHADSKLCG